MNRKDKITAIRKKLFSGEASVGTWMQIPHPSIAEILGRSAYDWVAVDMEHGTIGTHQLPDIFRALELGGTLPLVRLAQGEPTTCKRALDAGAGGVIVPMVETGADLTRIRNACCWPPTGTRGVGYSRANLFGAHFATYAQEAQAPLFIAMIESVRAVENLEEILAVDGLDAILLGPYDLSASMNLTASFEDPAFVAMMTHIADVCRAARIPCGIHVVQPDPIQLAQRITEGFLFLAYSIDAVFLREAAINPGSATQ